MPFPKRASRAPRVQRAGESDAVRLARRVLAIEAEGLAAVGDRLDERFDRAVEILEACRGKVVVTGMGKSGIVCRKVAATFASTGKPASFLHPAEAVHGDFGLVAKEDAILALSHSGETEEILRLLPLFKRFDLPLVAMTGNVQSTLGRAADVVIDSSVPEEACPLGLAPTASTTAALALGDALAVALFQRRGFTETDFAVLHPAGSLGRRLLKVEELMHVGDELPLVGTRTSFADTLHVMTSKRLGVTAVVDEAGRLVGVVTDGDLRRALSRTGDPNRLTAADMMTSTPKTIDGSALAAGAIAEMERHSITSLFIVDREPGRPLGVIHLHDLLKAGA
jgi:arabinose-5-phosphate isomerase